MCNIQLEISLIIMPAGYNFHISCFECLGLIDPCFINSHLNPRKLGRKFMLERRWKKKKQQSTQNILATNIH